MGNQQIYEKKEILQSALSKIQSINTNKGMTSLKAINYCS